VFQYNRKVMGQKVKRFWILPHKILKHMETEQHTAKKTNG